MWIWIICNQLQTADPVAPQRLLSVCLHVLLPPTQILQLPTWLRLHNITQSINRRRKINRTTLRNWLNDDRNSWMKNGPLQDHWIPDYDCRLLTDHSTKQKPALEIAPANQNPVTEKYSHYNLQYSSLHMGTSCYLTEDNFADLWQVL